MTDKDKIKALTERREALTEQLDEALADNDVLSKAIAANTVRLGNMDTALRKENARAKSGWAKAEREEALVRRASILIRDMGLAVEDAVSLINADIPNIAGRMLTLLLNTVDLRPFTKPGETL